ncbi:MAG: tetratricopeptide repeat protein, partial [Phycisphaerales bacterium]|nr:tetratricopeptide repeat protein [Phycisphaerales bacterium]
RGIAARQVIAGLMALIAVALVVTTRAQTTTWRDSESLYRHAMSVTAGNVVMMNSLAALLHNQGRSEEAMELWREAAKLQPDHVNISLAAYERAVHATPNDPDVLNNLAWLLSTHPEASKRNGPRAVALAQRACDITLHQNASLLDTLAAARAENGEFSDALRIAHRARQLALASGDSALAAVIDDHIRLFDASQPLRLAPTP